MIWPALFSMQWLVRLLISTQITLFQEQLDDYVVEDNATRVIDFFIDGIDLSAMGFNMTPAATG